MEVSRDGRRVYFTNSLYGAWDDQFYPDGVGSWMAKLDVDPEGGIGFDKDFLVTDFRGLRVHQVRLQGATVRRTPTASPDRLSPVRAGWRCGPVCPAGHNQRCGRP